MDDILMPRITETMRDGVLLRWLAPDGAPVAEGELIAEVTVEDRVEALESPASGELLHGVAEGTEVGVGEPIGMVGRPSGPVQMGMFGSEAAAAQDGPPVSTPARRAAEELGVDLATVVGSGPGGRISRADVEAAAARLGAPAAPAIPEPEAAAEPEPEPGARAEPGPLTEPDADAHAEPGPLTEPDGDSHAEPGLLTEPDADAHAEPGLLTEDDGDAGHGPGAPPEASVEPVITPGDEDPEPDVPPADEDPARIVDGAVPTEPVPAQPAARTPLTLVTEIPVPVPRPAPPRAVPGAATPPVAADAPTAIRPVLERDVDVTELLRLRDALAAAAEGGGPGLDALVVRAIALAGDAATVAVRTGDAEAVLVPGADELSVGAIAAAILDGDEGEAPVTLLDLSAGGADRIAPAPGDGLVIAMGRIQRRPVVREHSVVPGRVITLTLTPPPGAGWDGAAGLLDRVAELLERPHALVL